METHIIEPKIKIVQVASNQGNNNLGTSWVMFIGRYDKKNKYRVLFNIPIDEIPSEARILRARIFINVIDVESNCLNVVTPYPLIDEWSIDTFNWCNQPWFNKDICGQSVNIRRKSQYVIDITRIIQSWYECKIPNYGIVLKTSELYDEQYIMLSTDENICCGPNVEICYELKCCCKYETISTKFIDSLEEVDTDGLYKFSKLINTSLTKTVMYFVENLGVNEITANLQVSPDGINFINEPVQISPEFNQIKFIVPCIFAKFTRVAVKNINPLETSRVKIWYQAQE